MNQGRWPSGTVPALGWVAEVTDGQPVLGADLAGVAHDAHGELSARGESEHGRFRVEIEFLRAVGTAPNGAGTPECSIESGEGSAVVTDSALVIACVRGRSAGASFDLERDGGVVVARWSHRDIQRISVRGTEGRVIVNGAASGPMLAMRIVNVEDADETRISMSAAADLFEALTTHAAQAQMIGAAGDQRARLISIAAGGEREQDSSGGKAVRLAAGAQHHATAAAAAAAPAPVGAPGSRMSPTASEPMVAAAPTTSRSRPPSRTVIVALAAAGVVVLVAGLIGAFMLLGGGDDPNQVSAAKASVSPAPLQLADAEAQEPMLVPDTINLTSAFIDNDSEYDPGNLCFGPGRNSRGITYLVVAGVRYERDFVQCGSRAGGQTADGYYRFARRALGLVPGSIVNEVSGDFVVDETSRDRSAVVRWTVRYGDYVVCQATARWGAPGTCTARGRGVPVDRPAPLVIEQKVVSRSSGSIWAGIRHPALEVEVP